MSKSKENKVNKPHILFSKRLFVILALLIEIAAFILLIVYFTEYFYIVRIISFVLVVLLSIRIVVSKSTPSYKIIWLFFLVLFPFVGLIFYLLFAEDKFTYREKRKLTQVAKSVAVATETKKYRDAIEKMEKEDNRDAYNIANYITNRGGIPPYTNTRSTYFPWGEDAFPVMLNRLKSAKHYIFIEYFIIEPGKMWNSMLEILKEKVKEGLDVRVVYDDLGCIATLPSDYFKILRSYGIKCIKYSPIRPFLDVRMNNRDHRKIMVIDGHTGFTGGINLADEYINEKVKYGRWKDNAIMFEGDAVFALTTLFLSCWSMLDNNLNVDYSQYLPSVYEKETPHYGFGCTGYVQPYCSLPFTYESIGQNVYIDICLKAKKYLYISTPYLILDDEMRDAISLAAMNGVDVRIITPHIPDKKLVFELTRSYYKHLVEAGVKIYEYLPGFIHAKTFVADDVMATVGTINLDYRSLYLHMENGAFIYKDDCIKEIKKDFINTFEVSQEITLESVNSVKWYRKVLRAILRVFAPLL